MEDTSVALRLPDCEGPDAVVYRFPQARAARATLAARRRRVAVIVSVAVVVATVVTLLGSGITAPPSTAAGSSAKQRAPRAVVVARGETLWDIARRYAPAGTDPRAYVDAVADLNGVSGVLQAGARVRLPR